MTKRVVLAVVAVAFAAILAPSAFAHNSGLTVTGSCNAGTGKYDLIWTVGPTTDTGLAPFIAASNRAAIPVDTLLPTTPTNASKQGFPESVSLGSGASVSAMITVGWSDRYRSDQTATFTAPGPCAQDTGSLKLSKVLSGGPAEYTGPFTIGYNCGLGHTGTESVAAGSSKTVSGIPVATVCTVNESLPAAPAGYTFGTPTFSESSGTPNDGIVTITTKGATVEVTTVNTLTRDVGSLTLSKVLSGGPAEYAGPFTINYDCNDGLAHDGSKSVAAGATSSAITGIPTGTQCTISETLPAAPAGYSFGSPSFSPAATVTISAKDQTVNVQTTNTLTGDVGSLTLSKVLSGGPAEYAGPFTINYDCNDGLAHDGSKSVAAGATSSAITGIPTGTQCTISETLPAAPAGYSFGSPSFSPAATVTISAKDQTVNVQTTNTLTLIPPPPVTPPPVTPTPKTDISVTKAATPSVQLPLGGGSAPITYTLVVTNNGPDAAQNVKVADAAPVAVKFVPVATTSAPCSGTVTELALDCTIANLAAGASVTITVNATVNADGYQGQHRHGDDDDAGDELEQQLGSGPDGGRRDRRAADGEAEAEAGACDLQHGHGDAEGADGERKVADDQREGDTGSEGRRRSDGQDHRPRDLEDGEVAQERQGQREFQADHAGHRAGRDSRHEGV